jgi:hypothetical protein
LLDGQLRPYGHRNTGCPEKYRTRSQKAPKHLSPPLAGYRHEFIVDMHQTAVRIFFQPPRSAVAEIGKSLQKGHGVSVVSSVGHFQFITLLISDSVMLWHPGRPDFMLLCDNFD